MRHRLPIATVLALLAAALPAVAAHADGPSANPPGMKRLSDERTITRWSYPGNHARIRSRPTGSARTVGTLHWLTEDGLPEVYIALASWRDAHRNTWVKIRVPKRPNGITGWVPRAALRSLHAVHTFLDLNRSTLRLTLYRDGKVVTWAHVGIGASATPTPRGDFYIREKFRVRGAPVYGPFALGTSAYAPHLTDWPGGGVVGLHGTNEPGLIPGRPSHGCIRLRNEKIARMYRLVPRGTPLHIHD
jgi:hypothetical protein